MRSRLWLVFGLVLAIVISIGMPSNALAQERETVSQQIENYDNNGERQLGDRAQVTPLSLIQSFIRQRLNIFGNTRFWYDPNVLFRLIMGNNGNTGTTYLLVVVALVFGWWGVRKVIRMLFRAFRRGKANV